MKRSKHGELVAALDARFSERIAARDGFRCVVCGTATRPLSCSHFFGKLMGAGRWLLRWCQDNAVTMCFDCHRKYEDLKGIDENAEPRPFRALMIERLGAVRFYEIEAFSRVGCKRESAIAAAVKEFNLKGKRWERYAG